MSADAAKAPALTRSQMFGGGIAGAAVAFGASAVFFGSSLLQP